MKKRNCFAWLSFCCWWKSHIFHIDAQNHHFFNLETMCFHIGFPFFFPRFFLSLCIEIFILLPNEPFLRDFRFIHYYYKKLAAALCYYLMNSIHNHIQNSKLNASWCNSSINAEFTSAFDFMCKLKFWIWFCAYIFAWCVAQ